jgi:CubicO group peptidase (beta-lactamase class C family)
MQGMNSAKLSVAVEFIKNRLPDAYSLLVVKNGYLVFEKYFRSGRPDRSAVVHSVTKSVMSALIGIALDKGYLKSVNQKIVEFLPEYFTDDLDSRKKEINLKHILTMTAGLKWNDWGSIMTAWYHSTNWARFTLNLPLENNPGDVFNYNTSISHLLSIILSKSTKMSTLDFANQNLFEPLGIKVKYWQNDPKGFYIGGFGLSLSARDLAKIGFLYLNNGFWKGQSIVPEYWVKESTRQWMHAHNMYGPNGYGYQWWTKEVDGCYSYRAIGRRGRFVSILFLPFTTISA